MSVIINKAWDVLHLFLKDFKALLHIYKILECQIKFLNVLKCFLAKEIFLNVYNYK